MRDFNIKRPNMKTTHKQIVDWCVSNIDECGYPVDHAEMNTHCFHCGYKRPTEKAHTVPWSNYNYDPKYDSPEYYRLLCSECHAEAPNVMDETAMDKWIVEDAKKWNPNLYYNHYWKERKEVLKKVEEIIEQTGQHGFDRMNDSTLNWCNEELRKWFKERDERQLRGLVQ